MRLRFQADLQLSTVSAAKTDRCFYRTVIFRKSKISDIYHVMIFTVDKSERMFYYLFEHLFQVYHPGSRRIHLTF